MSVVNTNPVALFSKAALAANNKDLTQAIERLATGKRINSAADDVAGMAISAKMSTRFRSLDQAVRNANDGISLLQTVDGAVSGITDALYRMRELAVQSGNDTNTQSDRDALNLEFSQLKKHISDVAKNTQWNGMAVLKNADVGLAGTATDVGQGVRNVNFHVGASQDETVQIGLKDYSFEVGTDAVASSAQLNLMANNLTDAENFSIKIDGTLFSVAATKVASSASADATITAGSLLTSFQTSINQTVGFENVTVSQVGSTLSINDSVGRVISDFTAAKADNSLVTATDVASITAGTLAGGGADPAIANSKAIFSGQARLNNASIATHNDANTALGKIDSAISAINGERAVIGAVMNRLSFSSDASANASLNLKASFSQISDTDYAKTTADLARAQIMQQAGTAMLTQANQQPMYVLALLI
jgi:flagellin